MKIILTESQYNLLLEADRRSIIVNKMGFSQEWADEFHNLSDKYSIWIANSFLQRYKKTNKSITIKKINEIFPDDSKVWNLPGGVKNSYQYILDWLKSPKRELIDLKTLTYDDALLESEEWHKNLKRKSAENYQEKNEIIIDYRNNKGIGYYWANLGTSYSEEECNRMGHCGRGRGQLFSLRSINDFGEGQSYLTADYKNGVIRDFKASGKEHPSRKYYKYIIDLLIQKKYPVNELSKEGYRYETNFKLSDLDSDQLKYVFDHNESLKYDINNKTAWPYILDAIVKKELSFNRYTYDIQLQLLKFSNNNEILINKMLKNAPSRDINDKLELLKALKNKKEILTIIRETTTPLNNMQNIIPANVSVFFKYFGEEAKLAINKEIENSQNVSVFISLLSFIGNVYSNYIDYFCDVLSAGFLKFDDYKNKILLNNRINRDIYKCAPNIDPKERYSYVSGINLQNQIIVRSGNGYYGVVNTDNEYIIQPRYSELNTSSNNQYVAKTQGGIYLKINSDGTEVPYPTVRHR